MAKIWAIILAAGESKRMGFPKMLLVFDNKSMIENVIENVTNSVVDNIMVVLGSDREKLVKVVEVCPVSYCYNDNYKKGMLESVKCGFRNIPSDFEAVLVFQGDQPLITPEVINSIIVAYKSSGKGIVIPVYENKRGHPLLIDKKYKDEIEKLDSHEGLRSLASHFINDVLEVETNDRGIIIDFDTYEDYKIQISQIP
jgi:molybdenum cofactor cytidylyltransferase